MSVFLHTLECYQGILIFTTNRATSIDKAFQSRVHFFISYRELDIAGRRQVWRNFLSIASKNEKLEVSVGDQDLGALADMELNGRQIKNAVSVSQAVSLRRNEPFTLGTIKTAIRLSRHSWDEAVYQLPHCMTIRRSIMTSFMAMCHTVTCMISVTQPHCKQKIAKPSM